MMQSRETTKNFIVHAEIWSFSNELNRMTCKQRSASSGWEEQHLTSFRAEQKIIEMIRSGGIPRIITASDHPELASELAGLDASALLAIPTFNENSTFRSILILYFNSESGMRGAVETWVGESGRYALKLEEYHYPGLERFGFISRHVHFPIGSGLPGKVWETGNAIMLEDLSHSSEFLRSSGAENEGLDLGVAFPCIKGRELLSVNVMLSTRETPVIRACEIWHRQSAAQEETDPPEDQFKYYIHSRGGVAKGSMDTERTWSSAQLKASLVGLAAETSDVQIWSRNQPDAAPIGWEDTHIDHAVAIPIFSLRQVISIVVLGW